MTTLETEIPEPSVDFDGGSDEDRDAVLAVHHAWLAANDILDYAHLKAIWHDGPNHKHFNTNGHTYENLADWENIWNFYRPRFRLLAPYSAGNAHIVIRGDMAVIAADNVARFKEWIGEETEVRHNPPMYRATQVCVREEGEWRVVHAHFSVQAEGVRPDKTEEPADRT